MKKEYKDLELETVRFDAEDVITASAVTCPDECECDGNVAICEYQCNVAF